MALIGLPRAADLTTLEMTPEQYQFFKKCWVRCRVDEMLFEDSDVSLEVAVLTAKNNFTLEEKKGDLAFEGRNNAVRRNRKIRSERRVAAGK